MRAMVVTPTTAMIRQIVMIKNGYRIAKLGMLVRSLFRGVSFIRHGAQLGIDLLSGPVGSQVAYNHRSPV